MTLQIETSNMTKVCRYAIVLTGSPTYKGVRVDGMYVFVGSLFHAARRAKFLVNRFGATGAHLLPECN